MKKILSALAIAALFTVTFASAAGAQDDQVIGTIESDPASVPEAGEHTLTANGAGFIPETTLLLTACTSPADELVPGVSTTDEIVEAGFAISPLEDCDITGAAQVNTDADGNFSQELTVEVGPNFFFSAGTLDGSQAGAAYIPIIDAETAAALAVTGVESYTLTLVGAALLLMGMVAVVGARRSEI